MRGSSCPSVVRSTCRSRRGASRHDADRPRAHRRRQRDHPPPPAGDDGGRSAARGRGRGRRSLRGAGTDQGARPRRADAGRGNAAHERARLPREADAAAPDAGGRGLDPDARPLGRGDPGLVARGGGLLRRLAASGGARDPEPASRAPRRGRHGPRPRHRRRTPAPRHPPARARLLLERPDRVHRQFDRRGRRARTRARGLSGGLPADPRRPAHAGPVSRKLLAPARRSSGGCRASRPGRWRSA